MWFCTLYSIHLGKIWNLRGTESPSSITPLNEGSPYSLLFLQVPVVFTQHGVAEPRLRTEVKPMTSLDYAWDEPTLPPFVTLTVKGAGSSEISCNMNDFQDNQQLYYENFIYIAATYTFSG